MIYIIIIYEVLWLFILGICYFSIRNTKCIIDPIRIRKHKNKKIKRVKKNITEIKTPCTISPYIYPPSPSKKKQLRKQKHIKKQRTLNFHSNCDHLSQQKIKNKKDLMEVRNNIYKKYEKYKDSDSMCIPRMFLKSPQNRIRSDSI